MPLDPFSLRDRWPRVVTVVGGHPCCLKSSVTRALSMQFEVLGLFTHQMGAIRAMWENEFLQQRDERYRRIHRMTECAVELDLPVIVEGTFERFAERSALRAIAQKANMGFVFVLAVAGDSSIVEERFRHRQLQTSGPDFRANDPAIYYDCVRRYEAPTESEVLECDGFAIIDSTRKTVTRIHAKSTEARSIIDAIANEYAKIGW